jgi:NAD(P)-dependent dehydrogenase (short-subunit alcohol dehydrogenase family)
VFVTSSTCKLFDTINETDLQAEVGFSMFSHYGHSKFCLNQLVFELSKRLKKTDKISLNLVHPGAIRTGIIRHLHCVGFFVIF